MSQHFMPRQSSQPGSDFALLMNRYDCTLVRDGEKWKFNRITIDNAWARGTPKFSMRWPANCICRESKKSDER